jgi:gluconolactonase
MSWDFELVAGPCKGPAGGVAWDGEAVLFSAVMEGRILRFEPVSRTVSEFRRFTNRTNGLAFGPGGELYGAQEGSRRVIEFMRDGSARPTASKIAGRFHNCPTDLVVDSEGRIWFADPYNPLRAYGPQLFPPLDHASVLRLSRERAYGIFLPWFITRVTFDTTAPRAVLQSPDERTLYVAEGDAEGERPRELRAYPIDENGRLGAYRLLHTFGADQAGPQRGIEGMCLDEDGNIVACAGWRRTGPGPLVYVFSPRGAVIETHAFPADLPVRCAFGGADLGSLYVTTAGGHLYRARGERKGFRQFPSRATPQHR